MAVTDEERGLVMGRSSLISRNVTIDGHRTSIRLEPEMWDALHEICLRERTDLKSVCQALRDRTRGMPLTASVRVYLIAYFRTLVRDQQAAAQATPKATAIERSHAA